MPRQQASGEDPHLAGLNRVFAARVTVVCLAGVNHEPEVSGKSNGKVFLDQPSPPFTFFLMDGSGLLQATPIRPAYCALRAKRLARPPSKGFYIAATAAG